jgi:twitching motility protein PilT
MFPRDEESQIRVRLSDSIRWIACQRLLPKIGGGRVAAFEVVSTSLRVKDVILHGESEGKTFNDIITQGRAFGMMTFDDCMIDLFDKGLITEQTSISYSSNRAVVNRGIDAIKQTRGQQTTPIGNLEVDKSYGKIKTDSWKK